MESENSILTEKDNRSLFSMIEENEHEQVVHCYDKSVDLKAIIAIHNTNLGPALGGTRMWNYASDEAALVDALRLSRGMTYKAAISGLDLGGGKAVIIGDPRKDKSEALFRRYGQFIESLNGKYITAEDVGISVKDIEYVGKETKYVTGTPESMGGSGDPSPFTAYGVFLGMKACAKELWDSDSLSGKKIAVQGIGNVGKYLVGYLAKENAIIYITDIYEDKLAAIADKHKAIVVKPNEIYDMDVDIYSPCALGATVNSDTLNRLQCSIIAGGANNQLADEAIHMDMLTEKGILYAPDFLVNSGGLINVAMQLKEYERSKVMEATERIYDMTLEVFRISKSEDITTLEAAKRKAEERFKRKRS